MKMTNTQAAEFCAKRAEYATKEGDRITWHRLREQIERDGLDQTEADNDAYITNATQNIDTRKSYDTTIPLKFLEAIYDEEKIQAAIAEVLNERVKEDLKGAKGIPLRVLYLNHLLQFLESVIDESDDLNDIHTVQEDIEKQLAYLTNEYRKVIKEALDTQE